MNHISLISELDSYEYDIDDGVILSGICAMTSFNVTESDDLNDGVHTWRVRAVSKEGVIGNWSATWTPLMSQGSDTV